MKSFLDVFKIVFSDFKVPAIPCYAVGELGPLMVFIPKAVGTLPVDYFVCHNWSIETFISCQRSTNYETSHPLVWP